MQKNIAFVFPGQGSQSVGMLKDISLEFPIVGSIFDRASNYLKYDLWSLVQNGPEEQLNSTEYTQIAMLVADVAIFLLINSIKKLNITAMAGHSLGEYAALVCAEALSLEDALCLVSMRAKLMQEALPIGLGAMAAIIGLEDELVNEICKQATDEDFLVQAANFNAPGQIVISGHTDAVDKAMLFAEEKGARMVKKIPVSVPCHCQILFEAAKKFYEVLETVQFSMPALPVFSNVTAKPYNSADSIYQQLAVQLYSPVQWVELINNIRLQGVDTIVECGPGKVLSGLVKRIDKSFDLLHTADLSGINSVLTLGI